MDDWVLIILIIGSMGFIIGYGLCYLTLSSSLLSKLGGHENVLIGAYRGLHDVEQKQQLVDIVQRYSQMNAKQKQLFYDMSLEMRLPSDRSTA